MSPKRLLAAIMFTDIEGYTSLMQYDEKEAVSQRARHKDAVENLVREHNGNVIQHYGDGSLSIFNSAVEAVECAAELQRSFLTEPSIPVRIGLHMGDIILSDKEVMGDAVNIASRIESCSVPGCVLISDKIHDQIRGHKHLKTEFLDAYELKNVEGTMPIYALANEPLIIPDKQEIKGKFKLDSGQDYSKYQKRRHPILWISAVVLLAVMFLAYILIDEKGHRPDDFSIAVLPFTNLSSDEDSEIFSDGITEDILTNLSKLKDLHVISRTSVMRYKNVEKSIPKIAKELNVAYILEGSIRKYGDKIRVTAQLIDAKNDEHIWAENYDKTLTDIFAIQTEVSQEIVDALHLNISFDEQQGLKIIPTQNIEAYQLFLKGRQEADKRNGESIAKSIDFYKQAIELDPNYAEAYAEIANSIFLQTYYAGANPKEATEEAIKYLDKAENINDRIARIYTVKGLLYNHQQEFDKAKEAFEKAIMLSPNDVTARHQYATFFYYNGQYEKQLEQAKIAYSLDPLSFATASNYFSALTYNEEFDQAEKLIKDIENNNKEVDSFILQRLYMRLYLGEPNFKKAIFPLTYLSKHDNAYWRLLGYSYAKIGNTAKAHSLIDSIKSKEPYELKSHRIAVIFAGLGEKDSVFYYLDTTRNKSKLFNSKSLGYFDELKEDPQYAELLKMHGIDN